MTWGHNGQQEPVIVNGMPEAVWLRQVVEETRARDHRIEQILGKALGYPWFKDDQKNFPSATEEDGVCVGDHVAETLAMEAAKKIAQLEKELAEARERLSC